MHWDIESEAVAVGFNNSGIAGLTAGKRRWIHRKNCEDSKD
jgi:hypothetical protein